MRLLDKSRTFGKFKDLGFSERDYTIIEANIQKPNGIIYITGPTGSGKTQYLLFYFWVSLIRRKLILLRLKILLNIRWQVLGKYRYEKKLA